MKVGVLGWDYGDEDPDSPGLAEAGARLGHDSSLFTLEEISYLTYSDHVQVLCKGEPAESFDAVICRANLYGEWKQADELYNGWPDRVERMTMLSNVPGLAMFDPIDVWLTGYSKFLNAQRLTAAGIPTPPVRSATSLAEVRAAVDEFGQTIVKPSFGLRGTDVERTDDPDADAELLDTLLERYGTLACQPYYPTEFGEYRITVAGAIAPICMLKLPAYGNWRCKTLEGASFEPYETSEELLDLAIRATRAMNMTMAGLDILPTADGYTVLEVNPVGGFLNIFGEGLRQQTFDGVYDWIATRVRTGQAG